MGKNEIATVVIFFIVMSAFVVISFILYFSKLFKKNQKLSFASHVFNISLLLAFTFIIFYAGLLSTGLSDATIVFLFLFFFFTTIFVGALGLIWFQSLRKQASAAEMTQALTGYLKEETISKKSQIIYFSSLGGVVFIAFIASLCISLWYFYDGKLSSSSGTDSGNIFIVTLFVTTFFCVIICFFISLGLLVFSVVMVGKLKKTKNDFKGQPIRIIIFSSAFVAFFVCFFITLLSLFNFFGSDGSEQNELQKTAQKWLLIALVIYLIFGIVVTLSRIGKCFKVDDLCEIVIPAGSSETTANVPLIVDIETDSIDYIPPDNDLEKEMTSSIPSDLHPETIVSETEETLGME